jgi:protein transport protein SEC23
VSIALVTFSRYISVYELNNDKFVKCVIMDGKEQIKLEDIQKMIGVDKKEDASKYVQNVAEARESIIEIIESLTPDPWLVMQKGRYERATYIGLLTCVTIGVAMKANGARIVALLGGPATIGSGLVASLNKDEIIRAHCDFEEETEKTKVFKEAYTSYKKLSETFIANSLTLDLFGFSTDQFGIAEMKPLVASTGGLTFMHEEFNDQIFKDNIKNYFALNDFEELKIASGASISVSVSSPLLIKGAFGPIHSLTNKSKYAAKEKIGEGETNQWLIGGLDQNLSITFFLDLASGGGTKATDNNAYIQFATKYKHPSGYMYLRVTTLIRNYLDKSNAIQYLGGADQETIIAVYSKLAARKSMEVDSVAVIRWLDRTLIQIMRKYSNFRKGDKASFQTATELYLLPQFFYYLRKGSLVRKFATYSQANQAQWTSRPTTGSVLTARACRTRC